MVLNDFCVACPYVRSITYEAPTTCEEVLPTYISDGGRSLMRPNTIPAWRGPRKRGNISTLSTTIAFWGRHRALLQKIPKRPSLRHARSEKHPDKNIIASPAHSTDPQQ